MEKKSREHLWKKLGWCFSFTSKEMPLVVLSLVISLLVSYINTLEPVFTGSLIDSLTIPDFRSFVILLALLFSLQAAALLLNLINGRISLSVSKRSTLYGEKLFFEKTIRRGNAGYLRGREAEVLNILQNDMSVVLSIWTSTLPGIFVSFFTLAVISYRLISINIIAFALTVVLSFIPFIVYNAAGKKEAVINREGKVCGDRYVSTIQDSIAMSYESTGKAGSFFLSSFIGRIRDNYSISYRKLNLQQKSRLILFSINILTVSAIYFFLGYSIYRGGNSVGNFMTAVLFSQQLRSMIQNYGGTYQSLLAQSVSIERVRSFMDKEDRECVEYVPQGECSITVENLSFSYGDCPLFSNFSLKMSGPGLYVIKGANGSGKTTLLRILLSMVRAEDVSGRIVIGGVSSSSDIAYLPSSPFLYSASIRDNLLLGEECPDEKLLSLFDKTGLGGWLSQQKDGLDTICDRTSMGLSKGQMMRFSLLGNLIRERKIYLVDEIEDGIDKESREKVFSLLKRLAKERLVVVVSHTSLFDDDGTSVYLPPA